MSGRENGFLDLTPLIDIIFQLVIFLVLTTAFIPFAIRVELPKAISSPMREKKPIIITITREGSIFLGKERVSLPDLIHKVRVRRGKIYLIKGDKGAQYGLIISVLNALKKNGVGKVGLLVEPER
ncbi:MAG: biopolymer transporter ExbD [Synergistetes bacterium]|nr:biopolymer transporter ExbD [Synergistota bacterium]